MKITVAFFLICLSFYSCQESNENKAKKAIKNYLNQNLNDFSSYEPVEYTKLDSSFTNWNDDKGLEAKLIESSIERYHQWALEFIDEAKVYSDSATFFQNKLDSLKSEFKPEFQGWQLFHKYRAKNKLGTNVLQNSKFIISSDLTTVISSTSF